MWKIIFGFIWELIIGKDVRPGKAYQHHKFRILLVIVVCASLFYNFMVTKRLIVYYDAFNEVNVKYEKLKKENRQLESENRKLHDIVVKHIDRKYMPPPPAGTM
jgi:hypothetical protein